MTAEQWRAVSGYRDHEVSNRGRVRTTAAGTGGGGISLIWLLLLVLAAFLVYKAQMANSIATAVVVALCTIPAVWALREAVAEWRFRRLYDRPAPRPVRVQPRALTRGPLAIEAGRPVVIDVDFEDVTRRMRR